MGIFLGLMAAICWGTGDFLARFATLRLGTYRTLFFIQFLGFIGLSLYVLTTGQLQQRWASSPWEPWIWALVAVVLNVGSSLLLYRAFEVGTLALVSPIAASYSAVTVMLAFVSGEHLSSLHQMALFVIFIGVVLSATPFKRPARGLRPFVWRGSSLAGIYLALAAACGYGATFWILGYHVTGDLGGIIPVWLIRGLTPLLLAICAPLIRQPLKLPRGSIWWCIAGISLFDTLGYIAYTTGLLQHGQLAIVTVLSSLYSVVTVILAWFLLHDRLQQNQWMGILVIFTGIALVNI
ncbi:DMT family transporter [Tengunoibacter tsumagoiensis]|uniref:EamA domain-containing protein n=1 Tax=Tengunoibacter tsumagoiensis TaxID=2014871 RepID=A0A401ZU79_9CHLR|nr:DMT family transporter [Tengunoibacter tsumagoiensis]GCE10314.1 hypothetical protein KTT_01730 [Tengunoibacter tsumagoiensis]